jgi:hypothetical protein
MIIKVTERKIHAPLAGAREIANPFGLQVEGIFLPRPWWFRKLSFELFLDNNAASL